MGPYDSSAAGVTGQPSNTAAAASEAAWQVVAQPALPGTLQLWRSGGVGPAALAAPPTTILAGAVSQALSDLTNMRGQYAQHCAEAEAAGSLMHAEAARRVGDALGGQFDYAAVRKVLQDMQRAARRLQPGKKVRGSNNEQPRASERPPSSYQDLWGDLQAFADAVRQEVDMRIARAKLHLPPAAVPASMRSAAPAANLQHGLRQQAKGVQLPLEPPVAAAQARPPPTAAAARAAERKRERSPVAPADLGAEAGLSSRRPPATTSQPKSQAPAPPAIKRSRAHIAFGTRCAPPRPAPQKGLKGVKLDASPHVAPKPKASKAVQHDPEGSKPDMLRALASAFQTCKGPSQSIVNLADASVQQTEKDELVSLQEQVSMLQHGTAAAAAALPAPAQAWKWPELGSSTQPKDGAVQHGMPVAAAPSLAAEQLPPVRLVGGGAQLQAVFESIAQAARCLQQAQAPPTNHSAAQDEQQEAQQGSAPGGEEAGNPLGSILGQHGLDANSLSGILQGVLDGMDAITQRIDQPGRAEAAVSAVPSAPQLNHIDSQLLCDLKGQLAAAAAALQPSVGLKQPLAAGLQHPGEAASVAPATTAPPASQPSRIDPQLLDDLNGHLAAAAAALQPPLSLQEALPAGLQQLASLQQPLSSTLQPPLVMPAVPAITGAPAKPRQPDAVELLSQQFSQLLSTTTSRLQQVEGQLQTAQQLQAIANAVAAAAPKPQLLQQQQQRVQAPACMLPDAAAAALAGNAAQQGSLAASADATCQTAAEPQSSEHAQPAPAQPAGERAGRMLAEDQRGGGLEWSPSRAAKLADCQVQTEQLLGPPYQMFVPFPTTVLPIPPFLAAQQFAFSPDEPTPDWPEAQLSVEFSEAAANTSPPPQQLQQQVGLTVEVQASPLQVPAQPGSFQPAEQAEQLALDQLAADSIQQYNQVMATSAPPCDAFDPWDTHMPQQGHPAGNAFLPTSTGEPQLQHGPTSSDPEEQPYTLPAASTAPPLRRQYNPFQAAPAQQQQPQGLQQSGASDSGQAQADMLALWEDYRVRLGIGQQQPTQQVQAQPEAVAQQSDSAEQPLECAASWGDEVNEDEGVEGAPARYQRHLWRPAYAASEPAFFHQQHVAAAGAGTALGLPTLNLEDPLPASPSTASESETLSSDSSWSNDTSTDAGSTSTPVAIARHRAQALHYKLLRRQLGKQMQLSGSLALTGSDASPSPSTHGTPGAWHMLQSAAAVNGIHAAQQQQQPGAGAGSSTANPPTAGAPWGLATAFGRLYHPDLYSPAAEEPLDDSTFGVHAMGKLGACDSPPLVTPARPLGLAGQQLARLAAGRTVLPTAAASSINLGEDLRAGQSQHSGWRAQVGPVAASQGSQPASISPPASRFCTNLGDHLSDTTASTAAPTLQRGAACGELAVDSSTSTLQEVFPEAAAEQQAVAGLQLRQRPLRPMRDYGCASAGGAKSQESPATPAGGLGSHLSDATPSDLGSCASLKLPGPFEVISLSRLRLGSTEEGEPEGGAGEQARGWGRGALRALKSRLAMARRGAA